MPLDPITQTYQAIRNALLAWQPWKDAMAPTSTSGFRPGNFPDLSDKEVLKPQLAPADKPMALLMQGAFTLKPFGRNSLSSGIEQTFPLTLEVGILKLVTANKLKYETLRALLNAGEKLNNLSFLTTWEIRDNASDFPFGGGGPQMYNGSEWVTVLQILTHLDLPRKTLLS